MGVVSPYSSEKHDIGILRTDGTTKAGLMLVRDKNNVPIYAEYDDEYLPDQKTETPGYDNLPVEKELALVSNDWRAGFGLETFDSTDPTRYYSSYNADLRFRGMGFLGPKATTVTEPTVTTLTIVNADMEHNANGTT